MTASKMEKKVKNAKDNNPKYGQTLPIRHSYTQQLERKGDQIIRKCICS